MPSGKDTIAGYIAQAAEKLLTDFEYIRSTNPHAGEKGREVEDIVREFLNRHMPQRFRATSGFVIDNDSEMSGHEDVLVYDALSSPVFRHGDSNQILSADAVASVIEVKSVLNGKDLENAFEKIAEVKKLRKTPLSEMDQQATQSQLTTTGTFGVVFGFSTDTKLETLAQHCAELNEKYDTYQRPDLVVVLNVGVINYTARFVGAKTAGDFAAPSDENFPIPPCYVQLTAREDGRYALNRFFTHLLAHLAFYPRRPSIPPLSVLLEGTASTTFSAAMYQYNTEARLVPIEPTKPAPNESLRVIKIHSKTTGESKDYKEAGTLTYIPWQDGGVVRMKGIMPLGLILKMVTDARPMTVNVEGDEYSMVLKVTRPEFEKWPAVIGSKSDLKATLAVPPPFEVRHFSNEGTGEPFMARIFLGIVDMAQALMSQADKAAFDDAFAPCLMPALEMRKSLVAIRDLVNNHIRALEKGSIVRKQGKDLVVKERIDGPLRQHVAHFLEMASEVIENLPTTLKFLGVDIHYYLGNEDRFHRGWERTQRDRPELAEYLFRLRPALLAVKERFKEMRYTGWHLPNIIYDRDGDKMVMRELKIDDTPIVEYVERAFNTIVLGLEELVMYGLKGQAKDSMMIDEIPIPSRNPQNAQRFKRNIRGGGVEWDLVWTGKGFYKS